MTLGRGRIIAGLVGVLVVATVVGCGTPLIRHPVPLKLEDQARVPGMPTYIRAWGDQFNPYFQKSIFDSVQQAHAAYGDEPPVDILALSGGGSYGAFGAGLLCGWSDAGTRPTFRIVTGISTGAVIAPFAFLGSGYDRELKELSTKVTSHDIFQPKAILAILGSDSFTDTAPLVQLLKKYYTADVLRAIAAEHAKGRRLYIGTTNLDAQRPVIWDMGAIASIGSPEAADLFRKVILASAAIPVYFPPVYLGVEAGGKRYDEMHVDGGTIDQVILYGDAGSLRALTRGLAGSAARRPNVYVIRNGKVAPEPAPVAPRVLDIAEVSISTMTKSETLGNLYRIYVAAQRDGLDFNLASIPADFTFPTSGTFDAFDPKVMKLLFDRGYQLGRAGYQWEKEPPGLEPGNAATKPETKPATNP